MKEHAVSLLCVLCVCVLVDVLGKGDDDVLGNEEHFLNRFAIRLQSGGRDMADQIAKEHGFSVIRELRNINVHLLEHPEIHHRSKRSAGNHLTRLEQDPRISHVQQEVLLKRVKRRIVHDKQLELPIRAIEDDSIYKRFNLQLRDNVYNKGQQFSDPKFKDEWYLVNSGQSGGERGLDLNVEVVWENGITGKGVVVSILDDGVDHTHPDLVGNYDPKASTDLNDKDDRREDPMPDTSNPENSHGTRCAGEVAAAANNDVCGIGIAYDARIGGVRVLSGDVTDSLEAEALTFNNQYIHVYSASWGPNDDGGTMEGPRKLALEALQNGVRDGRNGLGSLFVWATGNGGMNGDDCSADGYVSRPETLSVGSVTDWGRSPFFMENCSSTLAVVPSGGESYRGQEKAEGVVKLKVVTTDVNGGCIENFQGTSSAAPLAAGCVANVLQANPNLTWRDVQHIVIRGTRIPSADNSWTINGAGHHVSHRFGFGLMDCGKMVQLAQEWEHFPERLHCNITRKNYQLLPRKGKLMDTLMYHDCHGNKGPAIDRLEHVQVYIKMASEHRGDLAITLVSPSGTRSQLLTTRPKDRHVGDWEFTFMTVHSWDENPNGKWTLEVRHKPTKDEPLDFKSSEDSDMAKYIHRILDESKRPAGYIKEWSMMFYGTHGTRHHRTSVYRVKEQRAYKPSEEDVLKLKKKEVEISKRVQVKRNKFRKQMVAGDENNKSVRNLNSDQKVVSKLMSELWDILHGNGAREVKKKRGLDIQDNTDSSEMPHIIRNAKHVHDISTSELVREILRLLDDKDK